MRVRRELIAAVVLIALGFGLLGVAMLLALVLGGQLEEHLRVALTGSPGDVTVFITPPFSALFLGLSVVSVAWSPWAVRRARGAPAPP